jgi:hypothetical protein
VPISYRVDRALRLVFSRAWGVVTDGEMLSHSAALRADPRFEPDFNHWLDADDVSDLRLTSEAVRRLAIQTPFGPGSRRAVVASADFVFGMSRMFQLMRDDNPGQLSVFRDAPSAHAFLALPAHVDLAALRGPEADRVFSQPDSGSGPT